MSIPSKVRRCNTRIWIIWPLRCMIHLEDYGDDGMATTGCYNYKVGHGLRKLKKMCSLQCLSTDGNHLLFCPFLFSSVLSGCTCSLVLFARRCATMPSSWDVYGLPPLYIGQDNSYRTPQKPYKGYSIGLLYTFSPSKRSGTYLCICVDTAA